MSEEGEMFFKIIAMNAMKQSVLAARAFDPFL